MVTSLGGINVVYFSTRLFTPNSQRESPTGLERTKYRMSTRKRVVIPVDGSQHSEKAFEWYAKNIHDKSEEVLVLHVQEPPMAPSSPYPYGGSVLPSEWNKAVDESISNAAKIIGYYNKKCHELGMKCRLYKGNGKPGESICQLAKDYDANQILMGSRGCGTVRRTLIGSVSDYCVHHSSVPVTVIPPESLSTN